MNEEDKLPFEAEEPQDQPQEPAPFETEEPQDQPQEPEPIEAEAAPEPPPPPLEMPEPPAPPEAPEPPEVEPPPKEPSRVGRLARSLLRWTVALLVVFAVGVGATWFARVQPQAQRIETLEADLAAAVASRDALDLEVQALRTVRDELAATQRHLELLQVLVDVTSARLAVEQEDVLSARAALAGTEARLRALQRQLSGGEASAVAGMLDRLQLVLDELDEDAFAAQRDLEVMANNLIALERSLFGE